MKPTKKNSKFDLDLQYGQKREQRVASLLGADKNKIEVKTERDWWYKTGNIVIEVECWGKPSGLSVTESDYWVHILAIGDEDYCKLFFEVPTLKRIVEKYKDNWRMLGDNHASKCIMIPLKDLFIDVEHILTRGEDNEEEKKVTD
nr:hypothetical protein MEP433_gp18 [Methylophilales phage MEP433]WOZ55699.1 hypothetical protein MEP434_gp17 [Methylophilales phage MEP434]